MDNTNNKKLPNFLSDKPSDENSFDKNTTFEINKTILSNIINNNDNNKIIALTGKWGAGKNTVIEMLKKEDKNIEVVEFDTLSLDNNQIRRSFLLNLYNKLIRKDKKEIKFEPKEKSELENYISGNIKETTIKSNIKLLNTTKILIIIAFIFITLISVHNIVDIFSGILNKFFDFLNKFFDFLNLNITLTTWDIGIVILIIIGIISLLKFSDKKNISLQEIILAIFPFVNIPSDLLEKSQEKTENNDITSDDFKNYYHAIIDSYPEKDKKIALVIDNLDRIDAKKSMDIIYNLHLFMSANEDKKEKYKNIYFIILIDKEKFFERNFERNNDINDSNFFEKIFPIRLEISGIVNLNWRKFFSDKIDEVFKEMKIDSNIIMQSISLYEEFSLSNIVPRDIIYFINKVVYNYIVMIEGSIENIDNTERIFKASILNACYSMFVEERKKFEIKDNNKTLKCDIQKFVYNNN